jgi:hypothetical protein
MQLLNITSVLNHLPSWKPFAHCRAGNCKLNSFNATLKTSRTFAHSDLEIVDTPNLLNDQLRKAMTFASSELELANAHRSFNVMLYKSITLTSIELGPGQYVRLAAETIITVSEAHPQCCLACCCSLGS